MSQFPRLNRQLLQIARHRVTKTAFVPPGGDPSAGGAPPPPGGDPGMGGGPPMDPSAGGGAPPMDPSAGGGMPPPPPGGDPGMGAGMPPPPPDPGTGGAGGAELDMKIQQTVQQAMQAGANGGPGSPKQPKPDINTIATDLFQLKKMFLAYLRRQGIELPPDILDGPNRDPMTGAPALSPTGGSDVAPGSSQATARGAIKPIQPIQPALINSIAGKTASALPTGAWLLKEASDLLRLYGLYLEHQDDARDAWEMLTRKTAGQAEADMLGVGEPYPAAQPGRQVQDRAVAVAKMFRARRPA